MQPQAGAANPHTAVHAVHTRYWTLNPAAALGMVLAVLSAAAAAAACCCA
jgi:hypothetical protein